MVGLEHYLTVAAALFVIGIFGIFLNRKNVIVILMSIELILLAVNFAIGFMAPGVDWRAHVGGLVVIEPVGADHHVAASHLGMAFELDVEDDHLGELGARRADRGHEVDVALAIEAPPARAL